MFLKLSNTGKSNRSLKNPKDYWMFSSGDFKFPKSLA
ncbi:hypothetical protein N204_05110 [Helicobacter pylori UM085]|nr:hypothetical protein N204_05110 [Helicobacter pylori UM085]EQL53306.1 hypothetical protein N404_07325 [Helicobacter pylori FD506]